VLVHRSINGFAVAFVEDPAFPRTGMACEIPNCGGHLDLDGATGFGIEFDRWDNPEWDPGFGSHVALVENGVSRHLASAPAYLADDTPHRIRVVFEGGDLSVQVDGASVLEVPDWGGAPTPSYYVGFTSATSSEDPDQMSVDDVCIGPPAVTGTDLVSDSSWRASTVGPAGWERPDFDHSGWAFAVSPAPEHCDWEMTPESIGRPLRWWEHPGVQTMWSLEQERYVYLRKSFVLPEGAEVTSAMITTLVDDDQTLYVNGSLVYEEHDDPIPVVETDIAPYLVAGVNVIALLGDDRIGLCRHATVNGTVTWWVP